MHKRQPLCFHSLSPSYPLLGPAAALAQPNSLLLLNSTLVDRGEQRPGMAEAKNLRAAPPDTLNPPAADLSAYEVRIYL